MPFPHCGEIFSLFSALFWGFAVILFRKSGYSISPMSLNLFKNTIACLLFAMAMIFFGASSYRGISNHEVFVLVLSGIIGITLADTLFFISLNLLGASLSAIVDCLYSPLTVFFAFLLLGERISPSDYLGAFLIVSAVFLTSTLPKSKDIERKNILKGIVVGILSMAMMAFGIVIAKPIIDKTPVLWSTSVRLFGATVTLAFITLVLPSKINVWKVFRPAKNWNIAVPASLISSVAMVIWIAGMKFTQASIAAVINQMSTIFIVLLAYIFLKETLSPKRIIATIMAVSGVLIVILY